MKLELDLNYKFDSLEEQDRGPQVFGRFLLLDCLSTNDDVKVYRARTIDQEASKFAAIKIFSVEASRRSEYRQLYLSQLKSMFKLTHPGIVQIFDYGMIQQKMFVGMEYVEGKSLDAVMEQLNKDKKILPIPISLFMAIKIGEALSYAHRFTDKLTGESVAIVHQRVSPNNIILSNDGYVKLFNFGKARTGDDFITDFSRPNEGAKETSSLEIVGYLAPEYMGGDTIDPRFDQYGLAVVLWELITGVKLFVGNTPEIILAKIVKGEIDPPSKYNNEIDPDLDQIILKALSVNKELRYDSIQTFCFHLQRYLQKHHPAFNSSDLRGVNYAIFKKEIRADRVKMIQMTRIDPVKWAEQIKKKAEGSLTAGPAKRIKEMEFALEEYTAKNDNLQKLLQLDFSELENIRITREQLARQKMMQLVRKVIPHYAFIDEDTGPLKKFNRSFISFRAMTAGIVFLAIMMAFGVLIYQYREKGTVWGAQLSAYVSEIFKPKNSQEHEEKREANEVLSKSLFVARQFGRYAIVPVWEKFVWAIDYTYANLIRGPLIKGLAYSKEKYQMLTGDETAISKNVFDQLKKNPYTPPRAPDKKTAKAEQKIPLAQKGQLTAGDRLEILQEKAVKIKSVVDRFIENVQKNNDGFKLDISDELLGRNKPPKVGPARKVTSQPKPSPQTTPVSAKRGLASKGQKTNQLQSRPVSVAPPKTNTKVLKAKKVKQDSKKTEGKINQERC